MNKRAFTLIEVLVSILILSVVAVALFEISARSKNNFSFLEQKAAFTTLASLPLLHNKQALHNKEKDLYEFVKPSYDIKDDDLRKYLKSKNVHYEHEEYSVFKPFSEGDKEVLEDQNESMDDMTKIELVFDKILVYQENQSTYAYKITIRQ